MKIYAEELWGFGNFLYMLSLPLCHIKQHGKKNELTVIGSKLSDTIFDVFTPNINISKVKKGAEHIGSDDIVFRGFNFAYDLSSYTNYLQYTLPFSSKSLKLCDDFLKKVVFANDKKEYISINIRSGDFKTYYNNQDEVLNVSYFVNIIDSLPVNLPIIVNIIPKEETNEYKEKLNKYKNRIYFSSESLEYPMYLPLISRSRHCVISNSTFFWWGAFLNSVGTIYYPDPWFRVFKQKMWFPRSWKSVKPEETKPLQKKQHAPRFIKKELVVKTRNESSNNVTLYSISLRNKLYPSKRLLLTVGPGNSASVKDMPNMLYRKVSPSKLFLFNKSTNKKIGEILNNKHTGEYLVSLDVDGKTSATSWIGRKSK